MFLEYKNFSFSYRVHRSYKTAIISYYNSCVFFVCCCCCCCCFLSSPLLLFVNFFAFLATFPSIQNSVVSETENYYP